MKTYVLALMIFGFFSVDAASQPYGGDADIDERPESAFSIPIPSDSRSPMGSLAPSHTAIDIGMPASNEDGKKSTISSMKSFSQVNPAAVFDRDAYLTKHVGEMIEEESRFKAASRVCRWCNVGWLGIGGISTASSLIVSAIGATEYIDPRLSNVLSVVFGIVSGGCMWAANQSKKASHEYHEEVSTIQRSLGVPANWVDPEVDLGLAPYNPTAAQPPVTSAP